MCATADAGKGRCDALGYMTALRRTCAYVVALGKRNLLWDLLPDHIEEHVLEVDHAE